MGDSERARVPEAYQVRRALSADLEGILVVNRAAFPTPAEADLVAQLVGPAWPPSRWWQWSRRR